MNTNRSVLSGVAMSAVPSTFPETVTLTEADTRLAEESSRRLARLLGRPG
jgi:hypothetical protein